MLPLPYFIQWQATIALQGISSELGVILIRAMGIPVFLDGNIIDLGTWKLHVAEACSGLRYLFPIMSFTYLFAVLYQGSMWHKALLLLAAIPIAILMNAVRVGIIGIIVDSHGIEHAEGFMHFFEGWVVFIICILLMMGLARLLQRLSRDRRSLAEVLDLDTTGLWNELARVRHIRASSQWIGLSLIFALGAGAVAVLSSQTDGRVVREPFLLFPREVGGWQGVMNPDLSRDIADVLGADDYLSMNFSSLAHAAPTDLFIAWYEDQSQGGIHSPEVCIPAGGWEMSAIETSEITVNVRGQGLRVPVNRAVIQKGLERQLVYYWFDQAGRRLASDYAAKVWLVWDAYDRGRTDGALVRLITPITQGEDDAAADARLQSLMGDILPELPQFISAAPDKTG
jgi:exosortase D (VPLPA-CTERM-specific)